MKISKILSLPFAMAADVVTLGNMGGRSFTQQVFDAELREQNEAAALELIKALAPVIAAHAMSQKEAGND